MNWVWRCHLECEKVARGIREQAVLGNADFGAFIGTQKNLPLVSGEVESGVPDFGFSKLPAEVHWLHENGLCAFAPTNRSRLPERRSRSKPQNLRVCRRSASEREKGYRKGTDTSGVLRKCGGPNRI